MSFPAKAMKAGPTALPVMTEILAVVASAQQFASCVIDLTPEIASAASNPSVSTKVITGTAKASQVLIKRESLEQSASVSLSDVLFVAAIPTVAPLTVARAVYEAFPNSA